jgi:rhodanese-related sulfurtransferase
MICRPTNRASSGGILFRVLAGLALVGLLALGLLFCRSVDWFLLKRSLRSQFSDVQWISTAQLADWIADRQRPPPILLDVRTRGEWKVSHLPQARLVLPETDPTPAVALLPRNAPIVTYCAIGYRSARAAQRLRAAGYSKVWNLEGSVFQWANEHRPLIHDGKRVTRVHPYSAFWGRLLAPEARAPMR